MHPLAIIDDTPQAYPILDDAAVVAANPDVDADALARVISAFYAGHAVVGREALEADGLRIVLPAKCAWMHLVGLSEAAFHDARRRAGQRSALGQRIEDELGQRPTPTDDDVRAILARWLHGFEVAIDGHRYTARVAVDSPDTSEGADDAIEAATRTLVAELGAIARAPGVSRLLEAHDLPPATRRALEQIGAPRSEADLLPAELEALEAHRAWMRRFHDHLIEASLRALDVGPESWEREAAIALFHKLAPPIRQRIRRQARIHIQRVSAGKSPTG